MNAVTQYNKLMTAICFEHNTIGTRYSENTYGWNLRDMVSEVQYTLDLWEDPDCLPYQDAHDDSQPDHKPWYRQWLNEKARMKRFIDKYRTEALKMECTVHHSSAFD